MGRGNRDLKALSGKTVCKLLEKEGWTLARIRGSHHIYTRPDRTETISVPVHGNRSLKKGTLHGILKRAGLPRE